MPTRNVDKKQADASIVLKEFCKEKSRAQLLLGMLPRVREVAEYESYLDPTIVFSIGAEELIELSNGNSNLRICYFVTENGAEGLGPIRDANPFHEYTIYVQLSHEDLPVADFLAAAKRSKASEDCFVTAEILAGLRKICSASSVTVYCKDNSAKRKTRKLPEDDDSQPLRRSIEVVPTFFRDELFEHRNKLEVGHFPLLACLPYEILSLDQLRARLKDVPWGLNGKELEAVLPSDVGNYFYRCSGRFKKTLWSREGVCVALENLIQRWREEQSEIECGEELLESAKLVVSAYRSNLPIAEYTHIHATCWLQLLQHAGVMEYELCVARKPRACQFDNSIFTPMLGTLARDAMYNFPTIGSFEFGGLMQQAWKALESVSRKEPLPFCLPADKIAWRRVPAGVDFPERTFFWEGKYFQDLTQNQLSVLAIVHKHKGKWISKVDLAAKSDVSLRDGIRAVFRLNREGKPGMHEVVSILDFEHGRVRLRSSST